jgi:hypothetical protein
LSCFMLAFVMFSCQGRANPYLKCSLVTILTNGNVRLAPVVLGLLLENIDFSINLYTSQTLRRTSRYNGGTLRTSQAPGFLRL